MSIKSPVAILYDKDGNAVSVDSIQRLVTTSVIVVPDGFADASTTVKSMVPGSTAVDTDYIVPNGKKLILSQFFGGGAVSGNKDSKFELYQSVDGGATDGTLLAFGYIGNGANNFQKDLNHEILGVGVDSVVRMRRERMDNAALELASGWIGIEEI